MSNPRNGTRRQADRSISEDDYQAPSQSRFHAPKGYDDSVWMLAELFDAAAKYHGQSIGHGLPVIHGIISQAVTADQGKSGWQFIVAMTFSKYWSKLAPGKPAGVTYDHDWAQVYPPLRDEFEDRLTSASQARLEAKREESRQNLDIVRRIK